MRGRYLLLVVAVVVAALYLRLRSDASAAAKSGTQSAPFASGSTAPASAAEIPSDLSRPLLQPAARDPFAPAAPLPPPQVAIAPPPAAPMPPAVPEAPPLGLTFVGRLVGPDGAATIVVSMGDDTMALRPGQTLPNGYHVDAIDDHAVHLSYPALQASARLELPAAPPHETR